MGLFNLHKGERIAPFMLGDCFHLLPSEDVFPSLRQVRILDKKVCKELLGSEKLVKWSREWEGKLTERGVSLEGPDGLSLMGDFEDDELLVVEEPKPETGCAIDTIADLTGSGTKIYHQWKLGRGGVSLEAPDGSSLMANHPEENVLVVQENGIDGKKKLELF